MDKFSRVSVNLCLSCVRMALRSSRTVHLAEKLCCFRSTTTLKASISHLSVQRSPAIWAHSGGRTAGSVSYRLGLRETKTQDIQNTLAWINADCERFTGLCLRDTKGAGIAVIGHKKTAELLLGACSSSAQSVRLYSSSTSNPQLPTRRSKDPGKSPISWKNLLAVAGVGCLIVFAVEYLKGEKENERNRTRNRLLGKAKLGGDWTLTDHHGNRRSSKDFYGQWLLIYFGFTHCPDVCPEEIEKIVEVINKTDSNTNLPKIQPIVITVDPDRDTPEALKEYCTEFSPRLLGFTGSSEEIQQATHAYRVYFSAGPKDDDNDYIVDHSIISYLINPHGEFVEYYGQNKTVTEMYASIQLHIGTYLKKEKSETSKSI